MNVLKSKETRGWLAVTTILVLILITQSVLLYGFQDPIVIYNLEGAGSDVNARLEFQTSRFQAEDDNWTQFTQDLFYVGNQRGAWYSVTQRGEEYCFVFDDSEVVEWWCMDQKLRSEEWYNTTLQIKNQTVRLELGSEVKEWTIPELPSRSINLPLVIGGCLYESNHDTDCYPWKGEVKITRIYR